MAVWGGFDRRPRVGQQTEAQGCAVIHEGEYLWECCWVRGYLWIRWGSCRPESFMSVIAWLCVCLSQLGNKVSEATGALYTKVKEADGDDSVIVKIEEVRGPQPSQHWTCELRISS